MFLSSNRLCICVHVCMCACASLCMCTVLATAVSSNREPPESGLMSDLLWSGEIGQQPGRSSWLFACVESFISMSETKRNYSFEGPVDVMANRVGHLDRLQAVKLIGFSV